MLDYRVNTFLSLCETRSYTKTAKLLHISQPSVTQHIKYLEQHYNCRLFYYDGRNLELTKEGVFLYRREISMQTNEQEIQEHIQQMNMGLQLRVGMTSTISYSFVLHCLAMYMKCYPELHVQIVVQDAQQLHQQLESGALDVAFMEKISWNSSVLEREVYHHEALIPVSHPEKASALYEKPFSAILKEPLLIPAEGSGLREVILHQLNARNISITDFKDIIEVADITVLRQLLMENMGISFLFASTVQEDIACGRLQRIHISNLPMQGAFYFVYLKESLSKDTYLQFFQRFRELASDWCHIPEEPQVAYSL